MIRALTTHKEKILTILIYFAVFVSLIYPYTDYDWGWHFRYGEYVLTNRQLLKTDIYSWTMQGFPWVNHEWTYDPLLYVVFTYGGYIGASLTGAAIAFACFFLLTKAYRLRYWHIAIAGFFFSQLIEGGVFQGLRAQVVGYLPMTILMVILVKAKTNAKLLWWLPLLFFLWVNIHGTWAFGLLITAVFFACYLFLYPKERKTFVVVGLLSLAATAFNPFGLRVYAEILKHTSSPYLQNVIEWTPAYQNCDYCNMPTLGVFVVLLILAAFTMNISESLPFLIIALILFFPAINQRRNLPVFGLATLPFFIAYLNQTKLDLSRYRAAFWVILLVTAVTVEYNLFTRLPGFHFYTYNEYDYCALGSGCPVDLANYLVAHPPQGRGFNFYDWGGYFIGKQVPAQLFIDGRMHLWDAKNDYMPFADYMAIFYQGDAGKFDWYEFDWVVIPPESAINTVIGTGNVKGFWRIQYQDNHAIYFVRMK